MERIVEIEKFSVESEFETSLRPVSFDDYIGQDKIKQNLKVFIAAAKKRNECLDHALFTDRRAWVRPLWHISSQTKWEQISKSPPPQ